MRALHLRVPPDYRWGFRDPHFDLWHHIIDAWGFPEWIRQYQLSNWDSTPGSIDRDDHVLQENRIRDILGNNFITIAVDQTSSTSLKEVYGYLPVDLYHHDLLRRQGHLPGSWVMTPTPPNWLML